MAIAKDISYHSKAGIEHGLKYVKNSEKTTVRAKNDIENVLSYAENLDKTVFALDGDEDILVSGYQCAAETASIEFEFSKNKYDRAHNMTASMVRGQKNGKNGERVNKQSIEAYHIIQSFPEIEGLDPRLVHKLGLLLCERAFKDHQCLVSTHMNTNHLHNHIVMCAYKNDGSGKYLMNNKNRAHYRKINDEISMEFGLPILLDNDLNHRAMSYSEWEHRKNGTSFKDYVRQDIKDISQKSASFDEYVKNMEDAGYELKIAPNHITYSWLADKENDSYKKVKDKTLGEDYERNALFGNDSLKSSSGYVAGYVTKRDNPVNLYVSRFDANGRLRGDLEILFIKSHRLLDHYKDIYRGEMEAGINGNPIFEKAEVKKRAVEISIEMLKDKHIDSSGELKKRINETGIALSHYRKEYDSLVHICSFYDEMTKKISRYNQLLEENDINVIDDSYIPSFSEYEVTGNVAASLPMTPKQRRDLYLKLKDNDHYFLKYDFDNVSFHECNRILAYFRGECSKPSQLIEYKEKMALRGKKVALTDVFRYRERFEHEVLDKISDERQKNRLQELYDLKISLAMHGIDSVEDINEFILSSASATELKKDLDSYLHDTALEYKNLKRLEYLSSLCKNPSFVLGSEFANKINPNESISVDITKERQVPDSSKRKFDYYRDIDSSFFDRIDLLGE